MKKKIKGSSVFEMTLMMPMVLLAWAVILFSLFYFYDKNILSAAAYETAVVGSEMYREEGKIDKDRLQTYYQERIRGKLLFFSDVDCGIEADNKNLAVKITTESRSLKIELERRSSLEIPEKSVRRQKVILDLAGEVVDETGI